VTIGNGVEKIEHDAFKDCYKLTYVTSLRKYPPQIESSTFTNYNTLYVPIGCKTNYKSDSDWKRFSYIEEIDVTSVNNTHINNDNKGERKYYNLKGQRVLNPKNGIYIVNGKKVFIK
jgi:hypothetical protein